MGDPFIDALHAHALDLAAVSKIPVNLLVSREVAAEYGLVDLTPDEAVEAEQRVAAWRERREAAFVTLVQWSRAVDAVTDPLARVVLNLHACDDRNCCSGCDFDGYDVEPPAWPCRTVRDVMAHLGHPVPDNYEDAR